jgi:hypothetical protein
MCAAANRTMVAGMTFPAPADRRRKPPHDVRGRPRTTAELAAAARAAGRPAGLALRGNRSGAAGGARSSRRAGGPIAEA